MPVISREFHAHQGNYTPGGNSCRYVVVHYTGGEGSARNTAMWSQNDRHDSSFHYVLDGSGTIYQILDDSDTAWAVGAWPGYTQLIGNGESVSIEVCSNGEDFTTDEIAELKWLVQRLMAAHGIDAARVVRHYDCHTGRKECPEPYIDEGKWAALRAVITGGGDMSDKTIADAVWARDLNGVRAIDRVMGIDLYMPDRASQAVWGMELKACGGKSKAKYPAWQYLSNVDHRCACLEQEVAALKKQLATANANIKKVLAAVTK